MKWKLASNVNFMFIARNVYGFLLSLNTETHRREFDVYLEEC